MPDLSTAFVGSPDYRENAIPVMGSSMLCIRGSELDNYAIWHLAFQYAVYR